MGRRSRHSADCTCGRCRPPKNFYRTQFNKETLRMEPETAPTPVRTICNGPTEVADLRCTKDLDHPGGCCSKRFFRIEEDDGDGPSWSVVARDRAHAEQIMNGYEFGDPSVPFYKAKELDILTWREINLEKAGTVRVNTDDDERGRGIIPLADCNLGESFCSEY